MCKHHHDQDIKYFYPPRGNSPASLSPAPCPQCRDIHYMTSVYILSFCECIVSGIIYYADSYVSLLSVNIMLLRFRCCIDLLTHFFLFLNLFIRTATMIRAWEAGVPSLWPLTTCDIRNRAGSLDPSCSWFAQTLQSPAENPPAPHRGGMTTPISPLPSQCHVTDPTGKHLQKIQNSKRKEVWKMYFYPSSLCSPGRHPFSFYLCLKYGPGPQTGSKGSVTDTVHDKC